LPAGIPTIPDPISTPAGLVVVSPHPDDAAISAGALLAEAVSMGIPVTILLVTDGSEARLPEPFLSEQGWSADMAPEAVRDLRGRIRTAEALEEALRLGVPAVDVILLRNQRWFRDHRTPSENMHPDLSLRDVDRFVPGPIEEAAVNEIRAWIPDGALCLAPCPDDRLVMHRIVTDLVLRAASRRVLGYECLSTVSLREQHLALPFDEDRMLIKCHAILAHASMRERRRAFGGYTNPGTEFYDAIVRRKNASDAQELSLGAPYAERYAWLK
jgi:LmbE family N-acetylglucosaminyl deacetylase